jgi:hypothetical protein
MTRLATGAHLASWAGRTPLDNSSGTRTGRAKSKKGNRYLGGLLGETAIAAGKTQTARAPATGGWPAAVGNPRRRSGSATRS